jgi:MFS family permease
VWASIIGLILIYLTIGYFIGGNWADRSPHPETMYAILAWGAFTSGLVPFLARPVLRLASDAFDKLNVGVLLGSFAAVLILFIVPVTLLGTITPFAIRLAIRDSRQAGRVSGKIYAISTMGSFIGTFLPVLVLIPLVGTTYTFLVFSGFLIVVAIIGLWRSIGWRRAFRWLWMPIVLGIIAALVAGGPLKKTSGQIFEDESAYNYIQVLERDGYRILRLNEGQGIHSIWHPARIDYGGPWQQFLAAPFFNSPNYQSEDVKNMAILGLAAGTVVRLATDVFGEIPIDGYEIDPEIIEVGRRFFEMTEPNLNAIAQDGRLGLNQSNRTYSVIGIDAYRPPYIPWHMTTREFFEIVYDHLSEDGVMVINIGRSPTDRRLIDGLVGTIHTVFPSIYVMDVPESFNTIVYATVRETDITYLYENFENLKASGKAHPLLLDAIQKAIVFRQPTPDNHTIFTDDWAPIEWITNNMVLEFVLLGEVEHLR